MSTLIDFFVHVEDLLINLYKFKAQASFTYKYEAQDFGEACGRVLMARLGER